jgi:hypothetical protein
MWLPWRKNKDGGNQNLDEIKSKTAISTHFHSTYNNNYSKKPTKRTYNFFLFQFFFIDASQHFATGPFVPLFFDVGPACF